jgi:hypothetical protein
MGSSVTLYVPLAWVAKSREVEHLATVQEIERGAHEKRGKSRKRNSKSKRKQTKRQRSEVWGTNPDSDTDNTSDSDSAGSVEADDTDWAGLRSFARRAGDASVPPEWEAIFKSLDKQLRKAYEGESDPMVVANVAITALKGVVITAHGHTQWVIQEPAERVRGVAACDAGLFVNCLAPAIAGLMGERVTRFQQQKTKKNLKSKTELSQAEKRRLQDEGLHAMKDLRNCSRCAKHAPAKAGSHTMHSCLQILPAHLSVKAKSGAEGSAKGGVRGGPTGKPQ